MIHVPPLLKLWIPDIYTQSSPRCSAQNVPVFETRMLPWTIRLAHSSLAATVLNGQLHHHVITRLRPRTVPISMPVILSAMQHSISVLQLGHSSLLSFLLS